MTLRTRSTDQKLCADRKTILQRDASPGSLGHRCTHDDIIELRFRGIGASDQRLLAMGCDRSLR
jgi:hypothetical protein